MKPVFPLMLVLVATSPAFAAGIEQSDSAAAKALDLSVPNQNPPTYSEAPTPPPADSRFGAPYDPARRFSTIAPVQADQPDRCDGKPHGSATVGVGYTSHLGNSNFQAAQLNSCKRYYDDNGNAHEVGVSIGIGQSSFGSGRGQRGWRGRGW